MDVQHKLGRVKAFLARQDSVRAAYLFGSVAESREGPLSDIDFAVLLDSKLSGKDIHKKKMLLISKISSIMGTDNLDLVVMNEARLLMNYNIIKNGKVLKSTKDRIPMEARLMCNYLDRKYYEDLHARITLERISEKGIL